MLDIHSNINVRHSLKHSIDVHSDTVTFSPKFVVNVHSKTWSTYSTQTNMILTCIKSVTKENANLLDTDKQINTATNHTER